MWVYIVKVFQEKTKSYFKEIYGYTAEEIEHYVLSAISDMLRAAEISEVKVI